MLRARINASALKRGHVDVFVTYANTRADAREVSVDGTLLEAFAQALKGAKEALDPYRRMTAAEALTLSGALTITQAEEDAGAVGELAGEAFDAALGQVDGYAPEGGGPPPGRSAFQLGGAFSLAASHSSARPGGAARIPPASHGQTGRMAGERRCAARGAGGGPYGRSLRDRRGAQPPGKPHRSVPRQRGKRHGGGPQAGFPDSGNEPRNQHHRLQGVRREDCAVRGLGQVRRWKSCASRYKTLCDRREGGFGCSGLSTSALAT